MKCPKGHILYIVEGEMVGHFQEEDIYPGRVWVLTDPYCPACGGVQPLTWTGKYRFKD